MFPKVMVKTDIHSILLIDGNGRTGRIINILYLVEKGLLDLPILYLSQFIIDNKSDYYKKLREVSENVFWEAWVLYMLHAVESTARKTREKIYRIRDLMFETQELARQKAGTAYSKDLIELIFELPYCKIGFLEERGVAKRQTASVYLKKLESIGILEGLRVGRETRLIGSLCALNYSVFLISNLCVFCHYGGKRVMLDRDLSLLYDVETKYLKQAVKRNIERFPEDFMFTLSNQEFRNLRSQIATSSYGGTRYSPMAFTEQGVAMISSVLKSKRAIEVNIQIMRTFTNLSPTV